MRMPSATNALMLALQPICISALRLSKPYHDIVDRGTGTSDYAVSFQTLAGLSLRAGKRLSIFRCCLDWLQTPGV